MASFPEALRYWARERPNDFVFRQIEGTAVTCEIDFETLARRVDALAWQLHSAGLTGRRIVLVFPTGIEFVVAFLACLVAGAVAVPSDPPRRRSKGERLRRILEDSGAGAILGGEILTDRQRCDFDPASIPESCQIFTIGDAPSAAPSTWRAPGIAPRDLAMLQYTSGSTTNPRGVMLTHGQLVANCRIIAESFEIRRDDACHSWLPVHHAMGLIGGILTPLLLGGPSDLASPASFLVHPLGWLRAISSHGITVTGGPCGKVITKRFHAQALRKGLASPSIRDGSETRVLVSNGRPAAGVEVAIVDPAGTRPSPPDRVGEIWVRSPSVGLG